ncbi:serine/threonine protein kinase, partial [Myxococcus sp. AM011]|nr:serine/threonine protein kinase [Myxococcus sp. AM011]
MPKAAINRDAVSGEALFILRNLRENGRLGRSNKLADVKAALEPSVSLEFDNYFFFLRKFHYIAMDREAQLKLTEQGERVAGGELGDKFSTEVGEFFAEQLASAEDEPPVAQGTEEPMQLPPPPPELLLDEAEVVPTAATQIAPPPSPPSMAPMRAARSAMPALDLTPPPSAPAAVASPVALITPAIAEPRRETSIGLAPAAPAPLPLAPPASSASS